MGSIVRSTDALAAEGPAGARGATDLTPERGSRPALARYEAVLLGIAAFAAPPVVLGSFLGLGFLFGEPGRFLTAALELGVPLAVGLSAASLLASEPALELQLSTRGGFRPAALRRLAGLVAWAAVLSLVALALGRLGGLLNTWPGPADPLRDVLMALAPLAAFGTWGALLGVALRSRGAAAAAVTAFWLAGIAWKDIFLSTDWLRSWYPFLHTFAMEPADALVTRLTLLAVAAAGLAILVAWLGRGEWLLGSEDR